MEPPLSECLVLLKTELRSSYSFIHIFYEIFIVLMEKNNKIETKVCDVVLN
jgi:hypothetical protein